MFPHPGAGQWNSSVNWRFGRGQESGASLPFLKKKISGRLKGREEGANETG